jgi:hypothetical protein
MRISQERLTNQKMPTRKSISSLKSDDPEIVHKKVKPLKLSRKEARARIGLGDIPDEKIREIVKVKKNKLSISKQQDVTGPANKPPAQVFQYQKSRSRVSIEPRISNSKSTESIKESKPNIKETLKIKFPETKIVERITIDSKYDNDLMSSINDMGQYDEFNLHSKFPNGARFDNDDSDSCTPMYDERKKHRKISAVKLKNSKTSKIKDIEQHPEEVQLTEQEKMVDMEAKKELVKQQKRAQNKKMKEEKEHQTLRELKKKQNLEALNEMLKKRTESYKKKKVEQKNTPNDPFNFDEENKDVVLNRLTEQPVNQSQDNFRIQHFVGPKLPTKHKTAKNSNVTSVSHSIQSPLSRKPYHELRNRASISEDSTKATILT